MTRPSVVTTIKLPADLLAELDAAVAEQGTTRRELIEIAVRAYLGGDAACGLTGTQRRALRARLRRAIDEAVG